MKTLSILVMILGALFAFIGITDREFACGTVGGCLVGSGLIALAIITTFEKKPEP